MAKKVGNYATSSRATGFTYQTQPASPGRLCNLKTPIDMKTTIQTLVILALAGSITCAQDDRERKRENRERPNPAEIMKKLDTNGDGSISKDEFLAGERAQNNPERAAKAFTHMDSDGDGQLSPKDFAQRRGGGPDGRKRPNPAEIYKHLDKDGSGSISKEEFLSGERAQKNPEMAEKLFGKLDADNSGDISRDEFAKRPRGDDKPGDRRPGDRKPGDRKPGERPGPEGRDGDAGPDLKFE